MENNNTQLAQPVSNLIANNPEMWIEFDHPQFPPKQTHSVTYNTIEERRTLEKVTVKKEELLEALKANRDSHRSEFLKAQAGWKAIILEELERRLADARNGLKVMASFHYPEPEDHTKDYNRVIRMVEMEVENKITMGEREFSQFVMDDWDWKAHWTASNMAYVSHTGGN